ncbi:AMP-binding protein [Salidesulfovibrio brasiliensis]|uniref:AMP-binding protein n=1 Tax=Salidesulfovibrio brasiliensis TaxID=221711 RepID=UPI0006CFF72E|nr:AMP-binding protein [Salidesulfovibrio brasiliensis]
MKRLEVQTLKHALERSAELFPERNALSFVDGEPLTYAKFYEMVRDVSLLLQSRGIGPGDKVAIIGENMPHWGVAYFAVTCMGAVAVPILQEFHVSAVHHILRHSEAQVVFCSKRYFDKVEEFDEDTLHTRIVLDDLSMLADEGSLKTNYREAMTQARAWYERTREKVMQYFDRGSSDITPDSLAVILYTSGTTGHSKGVMLTHRNIVFDAESTAEIVNVTEEDSLLSVLPLSHTYECTLGLMLPIIRGASVYYLQRPPTPRTLLPAMQKIKPTYLLLVPLVIEKIYRNRILPKISGNAIGRNLMKFGAGKKKLQQIAGKKLMESFGGNIKCIPIGGAFLAPEVERFLRNAEVPYAIGYGMTETSPLVSGSKPEDTRFRAAGKPIPEVEIFIDNPDPETGEGEILVKGPNVMTGYYKAPKVTEEVLTEDGWLHTGDLGYIDEDGYLFIRGRLKNVIIGPSGENIYPEEIEAHFNDCEYVLESLVFRQDGKLCARVHLDDDALDAKYGTQKMTESKARLKLDEVLSGILKQVNANVSNFCKVSRIIEQVEPFDKTPTHKIKRYLYVDPDDSRR